jgi:hypothetical protein
VDWVHGAAHAPLLDLPGAHQYGDHMVRFRTTYADPAALAEFPHEFGAFIGHVNRPPRPGPLGALRSLVAHPPAGGLSEATYIDALRAEVERAGGHLIEAGLMEEHFKVAFRDARYLHRLTGKFYLYLLTVLRPVTT